MEMATTTSKQLQLLDLPNEIISHIFDTLDSPSPFSLSMIEQPGPRRKRYCPPLKHASILSHRLRKLVLPILFHHVYLNPQYLKPLLSFLKSNSLTTHVTSVAAYLPSPCSHYHPPWWSLLLASLPNLSTISVLAPPHNFGEIAGGSTHSSDSWAFNIKHQILSVSYDPTTLSASEASPHHTHLSLLDVRPWTSLTLNEASSLKAYTTYEYFLRRTPSPIYAIQDAPGSPFLAKLTAFSFIAIFPIYSHLEAVLKRVKVMPNLRRLFVKLIPEPESTVLDDEIKDAIGHFDVNDPWAEFETGLALVADACVHLSEAVKVDASVKEERRGVLEELKVDDVRMLGVKDNIEEIVTRHLMERKELGWAYEDNGLWKRKVQVIEAESAGGKNMW